MNTYVQSRISQKYGDSMLVINQINVLYKVKNQKLFELYNRVNAFKTEFKYIYFNHVYRKDNKRADKLSNLALIIDAETNTK
jgi:ribonuclease HI